MSTTANVGSGDRLSFTFFLAAALHALVIFGFTFSVDSGSKIAPTLNITLATHKAKVAPEKADFLAQHNQEASGTIDEVKELTTTQHAELESLVFKDTSLVDQQKKLTRQDAQRKFVTTTSTSTFAMLNITELELKDNNEEQEGQTEESVLHNQEFASLKAALDKEKQEYASRPRIRRLTSVSTQAAEDAEYLHNWESKIEAVGNSNFPELALTNETFGKLRFSVQILPNGAIKQIEILQSSEYAFLDEAAMQIIRLASPFDVFPRKMRNEVDRLEIIRTLNFEKTGVRASQ